MSAEGSAYLARFGAKKGRLSIAGFISMGAKDGWIL